MTCVFCAITRGQEPATIIRRWSDAIAITPRHPVTAGHTLIIPVRHVQDVTEDPDVSAATMRAASELAVPPCNIITSAGPEATQTVFHLHLHLVPRTSTDLLSLPWDPRQSAGGEKW
ncbi:HIT family protein [Plantactinospora sp. BB1]|uniref:HIT family protein n=1 Tax=Plantactinospora sp. BB1 TaxID=2071627 RepID=UPI000D169A7E|nr:HIT domain-containing protein [Plantactinospora sp. BB1]AVT38014.1 HIT family protein [Plantactinospora sp. BB1]